MRIDLMLDSLDGLSVGDALGNEFPVMRRSLAELRAGELSYGPWKWTDDTEMACSVVAELLEHGEIGQDRLAGAFARRMDPGRDYGFHAVGTMSRIRDGAPWREAAGAAYGNEGSCGNGGAMRVAPLGAYYADDPKRIVAEAVKSAQVTHMHREGVVGAVAVALAAGRAAHARLSETRLTPSEFITSILGQLNDSETGRAIQRAQALLGASPADAAHELGNGSRVTAQDTVPFTIWVAATHLNDYRTAITTCIAADGDIDTTSAIVGGIIAANTAGADSMTGIPRDWLSAREPLPAWYERARAQHVARPSRLRRLFTGRK
ncbi:ADP-ribosylglycohydrolase family protein [Nocardia callitridis]|uniref:ADP-ribosylglycohydrolase family protein n=1 Tax=Nocardia callitridis TaxID=648753 RepID=A0ABP9K1N5_9NOCA